MNALRTGRKPGSRNRATLLAAALLDGKAEDLVRKALEIAMAGDVGMIKFLLGRILPRERLVNRYVGMSEDDPVLLPSNSRRPGGRVPLLALNVSSPQLSDTSGVRG